MILTLLFQREAAVLKARALLFATGEPPRHIWQAMRAEGWDVRTHTLRDDTQTRTVLDRIYDPAGRFVFRAGRSDDDQGGTTGNKAVWARYRRTIIRLVRHTPRPGGPTP